MIVVALACAVLGLIVGSFLGVVAHRLPRGESFVTGRSRCDGCGELVAGYDNVPILSWLLLRGRCRHCGESIPARYPAIELAVGLSFAATFLVFEDVGALPVALGFVFVSMLATVTLTDLEQRIIPNAVLAAGAAAGLGLLLAEDAAALPEHLIAAAAGGGALLLVALAYPRGMGMGDVKLAAVIGLFLGSSVAPALLIGFLLGSIHGVALIARHGPQARKSAIPFGPFLAAGALIGLLIGPEIVDWYVESFFEE